MATRPIETAEVHAFPALPPMPAVARILARYDRPTLEAFLSVAIDLLDTMDSNSDDEDDDPAEHDGTDQGDQSSIEWSALHPATRRVGSPGPVQIEDAEDDDPDTDVEDDVIPAQSWIKHMGFGPGCELGDPGGCEHDGREIEDGV